MHAKFGVSYHWIPDRMKLPVFDGVQEALERRNVQRKRGLDRAKTTAVKKRRVVEGFQRSEWTKTHGRDAYGGNNEDESDHGKVVKHKRAIAKPRKAKPKGESVCGACGSSTHKRRTHPFNTKRSTAKTP